MSQIQATRYVALIRDPNKKAELCDVLNRVKVVWIKDLSYRLTTVKLHRRQEWRSADDIDKRPHVIIVIERTRHKQIQNNPMVKSHWRVP